MPSKVPTQKSLISDNEQQLFASGQKSSLIAGLLLAMGTLVLYNPAAHCDFINFDDDRYVFNNPHILQGFSWKTVVWAFQSTSEGNWHPLTWLSHALDYQLFGLNPAGHHYMSVLLHVCNTILLFLFLNKATGYVWRSFTVAALFAAHPINVESVAWVAERKNVLCTLFFFLALLAYLTYVRKPSWTRYGLLLGLFALGLMAKPMVITLPFVLLLLDYWPLGRMRTKNKAGRHSLPVDSKVQEKSLAGLFLEKAPLLLLVVGSAMITLVAQGKAGAVSSIEQVSMGSRLGNAAVSYLWYIEEAILPAHLAVLYPYPIGGVPAWSFLIATIVLLGVTAFVLLDARRSYLKTGWLWFLGTLVPVIGLVQIGNQARADRYSYIPFIGLFLMIVWGVAEASAHHRIKTVYLAVGAVAVIFTASVFMRSQLTYWRNSVTLWSHALEVTHNNFVAEDNLGNALVLEGREEDALPHFRTALHIHPSDPVGALNIGVSEQKHGELRQSIDWYNQVLSNTTDSNLRTQAYLDSGISYRMLGDYDRAQTSYKSALNISPASTIALVGMGLIAQKKGDLDGAIEYYMSAMTIQPTDVGYLLLYQAWQKKGDQDKAISAFRSAEKMSHGIEKAQQVVNSLLLQ